MRLRYLITDSAHLLIFEKIKSPIYTSFWSNTCDVYRQADKKITLEVFDSVNDMIIATQTKLQQYDFKN